ncbi:MAG: hypothetical protein M3Z15_13695 [Pseudomonadota bacterium]|nr:hypothetical protein [Pseudomonadota bacterium]
MTLVERRTTEQAAGGLPSLINFVNLTKPIYQLDLIDTVAWLDSERARRDQCALASARASAVR